MKKEIKGIIKKVKEEWGNKYCWRVFWIDVVFIGTMIILSILTNFLLPGLTRAGINALLIFTVGYLLLLAAVYSWFKYKVLKIIMGKELKQEFWRFWVMNMALFAIVGFIVTIVYTAVKYLVMEKYLKIYFGIILFIILLVSYVAVNIIQMLKEQKKDMEDSLIVIKKNIKRYAFLFVGEFLGLLVIYLLFFLIYGMIKGPIVAFIAQTLSFVLLLLYNVFNKFFIWESVEKS